MQAPFTKGQTVMAVETVGWIKNGYPYTVKDCKACPQCGHWTVDIVEHPTAEDIEMICPGCERFGPTYVYSWKRFASIMKGSSETLAN